MPSFTPHKAIKSPALRFRRQPNVYLLKDGSIVEGGSPHPDLIAQSFLFGHEPSGVSDEQAKLLLDYGFDLIPDPIKSHRFNIPIFGSSFGIAVQVSENKYARGIDEYNGASAIFTVYTGLEKVDSREVPWIWLEPEIRFSYILPDKIQHRVEVVLRNNSFELPPYVAYWSP